MTVYIPGVVTVMLEVVAPVFHSRLPAAVVDKVDDPQCSLLLPPVSEVLSSERQCRCRQDLYTRSQCGNSIGTCSGTVMLDVVAPCSTSMLLQHQLKG